MWKNRRERQAWHGVILVIGFLLASLLYSGAAWQKPGPPSAEAATAPSQRAPHPTSGKPVRNRKVVYYKRRHVVHRHHVVWHRPVHHVDRRVTAPPRRKSTDSAPPPPISTDLKDTTPTSGLLPATVRILAGNVGGTAARMASDMSAVLDSDYLRVMPVLGKDSVENLRDIATSPYLDLAIVPSDALDEAKRRGFGDLAKSITYITPLYDAEVQIVARGNISTIRQLDGKKVGVGVIGSGSSDRASQIFKALGLKPDLINIDLPSALVLLQHGALDAVFFADGKPIPALTSVANGDGLHFVAIPYDSALQATYYPAQLGPKDYPNLIKPGTVVETIAITTVLAAYNAPEGSPRYRKLALFTRAFFSKFDQFHMPGRHPKWREVNFAAEAPGWTRFKAAQNWLDQNGSTPATAAVN